MRHRKTSPRPFEIGAGVILLLAGVGSALAPAGGWGMAALALLGTFAGLSILFGLYYTKRDVVLGFGIERAGHYLGAGAWVMNGLLTFETAGIGSGLPSFILACAGLWRARHLRKESRALWRTAKGMRRT